MQVTEQQAETVKGLLKVLRATGNGLEFDKLEQSIRALEEQKP